MEAAPLTDLSVPELKTMSVVATPSDVKENNSKATKTTKGVTIANKTDISLKYAPRGKGLGKGKGTMRHKKFRDQIEGITKPAIRRLARRGGVKRISNAVYPETKIILKSYLENLISKAITYTEHARRKTVTAMDVIYALKTQGKTLYGFE